ncbi:hypothetical protein TrVFT333_001456 [Trichoderma virens FT-333]|nr:hypothetical protein TrVFT333_001456 [Trichoderma virens FT-333]
MSPPEIIKSQKYASADLIPFDPNSETQCTRLFQQRVACSWDQDLIEEWKGKTINDSLPAKDEHLAKHIERYPNEKEAIVDTAEILGKSTRTPTLASFIPIGHIALDLYPDRNEQFSLPQSTVWIKSLYISWAIQAGGFGRSAMHQIEHLATLPPLNATTMALDTVRKEFQTSPESIAILNKIRGSDVDAASFRSNEEWYTRQGYSVIARVDGMYTWVDEETGAEIPIPSVFLKKDLV